MRVQTRYAAKDYYLMRAWRVFVLACDNVHNARRDLSAHWGVLKCGWVLGVDGMGVFYGAMRDLRLWKRVLMYTVRVGASE